MSKLLYFLLSFLLLSLPFLPTPALAQSTSLPDYYEGPPRDCKDFPGYVDSVKYPTSIPTGGNFEVTVNFNPEKADPSFDYVVSLSTQQSHLYDQTSDTKKIQLSNPPQASDWSLNFSVPGPLAQEDGFKLQLLKKTSGPIFGWPPGAETVCNLGNIAVYDSDMRLAQCSLTMYSNYPNGQAPIATVSFTPVSTSLSKVDYVVYYFRQSDVSSGQIPQGIFSPGSVTKRLDISKAIDSSPIYTDSSPQSYTPSKTFNNGSYVAVVEASKGVFLDSTQVSMNGVSTNTDLTPSLVYYCAQHPFTISNNALSNMVTTSEPLPTPPSQSGSVDLGVPQTAAGEFCGGKDSTSQIKTAIGCIPTSPSGLVQSLLKVITSAAGGIALLLMIAGAFQMITSQGNPDSLKKGQEQFTSAIIGLLFIIFSVLLLQIIGVNILSIPGFKP